jgi:hypothetical protein
MKVLKFAMLKYRKGSQRDETATEKFCNKTGKVPLGDGKNP